MLGLLWKQSTYTMQNAVGGPFKAEHLLMIWFGVYLWVYDMFFTKIEENLRPKRL